MPRRRRPPLFLARESYRIRRLIDAARLLPLFGAVLVLMPILWGPGPGGQRSTVADGVYFFVAWGVLILGARLLAPFLPDEAPRDETEPPEDEPSPPSSSGAG